MVSKEMSVDEDLPHFYNITTLRQRKQMIKMYNNMKHNFGFETTDPDTIAELEKAEYPEVTITGTPWYNVLSNPSYVNDFQFVGSFVSEREKIIDDGYPDAEDGDEEYDWYNRKARKKLIGLGINVGTMFWEPEDIDAPPKNRSALPSPEEESSEEELNKLLQHMEEQRLSSSPEQRLVRC